MHDSKGGAANEALEFRDMTPYVVRADEFAVRFAIAPVATVGVGGDTSDGRVVATTWAVSEGRFELGNDDVVANHNQFVALNGDRGHFEPFLHPVYQAVKGVVWAGATFVRADFVVTDDVVAVWRNVPGLTPVGAHIGGAV